VLGHEASGGTGKTIERIRRWREICPALTIRSTFIVGFPARTDADFEMAARLARQVQLDRVRLLTYAPVSGAVANGLAAPVPDDERRALAPFMQRQQAIFAKAPESQGRTRLQVIIDEVRADVAKGRQQGRRTRDDGAVYGRKRRPLRVGRSQR